MLYYSILNSTILYYTILNYTILYSELLKVADVQTHVCAFFFNICAKFVFLNAKQKKTGTFYDFGTI